MGLAEEVGSSDGVVVSPRLVNDHLPDEDGALASRANFQHPSTREARRLLPTHATIATDHFTIHQEIELDLLVGRLVGSIR